MQSEGISYSSGRALIKQGVPQGSILGPLLFLLYVNSLSSALTRDNARVFQYADDTSVIVVDSSLEGAAVVSSGVVEDMRRWCDSNSLKLNESKTGLLTFSIQRTRSESPYVKLGHKSIPELTSFTFLGVTMDPCLSWYDHIKNLTSRLASICGLIRYLREQVSLDSLKVYYFAHVQSIISYGILLWGSSPYSHRIFVWQKRIVRCMLSLPYRASCEPYFREYKIMTVPSLYVLSLVMFVRKNPDLFLTNADSYATGVNVTTRTRSALRVPEHSTTFFQRGTQYRAVKAFQALPDELRNTKNSLKAFRKSVIGYLQNRVLYTFDQ